MTIDYISIINKLVDENRTNSEDFYKWCKRYILHIAGTIIKGKILDKEDIVSVGLEGVAIALSRYDSQKGNFCGYARYWIKGEIVHDYYRKLGVSRYYVTIKKNVRRVVEEMKNNKEEVSLEKIICKTKYSKITIMNAFSCGIVVTNSSLIGRY